MDQDLILFEKKKLFPCDCTSNSIVKILVKILLNFRDNIEGGTVILANFTILSVFFLMQIIFN